MKKALEKSSNPDVVNEKFSEPDPFETQKLISSSAGSSPASSPSCDQTDLTKRLNELNIYKEKTDVISSSSLVYKTRCKLDAETDGFCRVVVKHLDTDESGRIIFFVIPHSKHDEFTKFKIDLFSTYNKTDVPFLTKTVPPLFMFKFGSIWGRCISTSISDVDGNVIVQDIDTGKKANVNIFSNEIKSAKANEFEMPAYCSQVQLTNIDASEISIEDTIRIKLGNVMENEVIQAFVELESDESFDSSDEENEPVIDANIEHNSSKLEEQKRFLITDIKYKIFKTGMIKLTYKDGAKLDAGMINVCEASKENDEFYENLGESITQYIDKHPKANNYKPVVAEMILAKFTDGQVYRGMCRKIAEDENADEKNGCFIVFIDYGNELFIKYEDIWKLPHELLMNCVSRNVSLKLKSGRSLSEIDADATMDAFYDNLNFVAEVGAESRSKYTATIDDSLVVFK